MIPFLPSYRNPGYPNYDNVSYGSSVIIGPTEMAYSDDGIEPRPVCDIASINYQTATRRMYITYKNGGTATLDIIHVTTSETLLKFTINFTTDKPVCALRSNYVSTEKCDTSTVIWKDLQDITHTNSISSFQDTIGKEWFFTRPEPSVTRNSAPDIRIIFD